MESVVYNQEGKKEGKVKLPERLFGLPWNADLVHQVVTGIQSNQRRNTASARGRGEVSGGGKKPWRQKGTGRARHGSIRSPLWRGGGVTHGPTTERNYRKKINQKMKTKALLTVLSQKLRDGEVLFLDDLRLAEPKTRLAAAALGRLAKVSGFEQLTFRRGRRALVALPGPDPSLNRSFRNLQNVLVTDTRQLNPLNLLTYQYLIFPRPAENLAVLESRVKVKQNV